MQDVVVAKPYRFVPPVRWGFWPAVFRPLLRPILANIWGVTTVEIVGIESLRSALRERAGASRPQSLPAERPVGGRGARGRGGHPALYHGELAPVHGPATGGVAPEADRRVQRLPGGGRSHGHQDRHRVAGRGAAARHLPRGDHQRSNDRLGALDDGPAFIAHSAAKQRARNEPGARTLLFPVALRYRFLGRLDESAAPVLDRIETRLTWTPRPDLPLIERLRRAGNAILGLQELELVGEFRHATIAERLARLIDEILGPLEAEWKVKKRERDVPAAGARRCRTAILPDLVEGGLSDAERDRRWDQLARLYLAQRLSLYPPGYLEGHPSTERVLETVERLEEDLTDAATVHRPIAVTVSVGEPIAVSADGPRPPVLTERVRAIDSKPCSAFPPQAITRPHRPNPRESIDEGEPPIRRSPSYLGLLRAGLVLNVLVAPWLMAPDSRPVELAADPDGVLLPVRHRGDRLHRRGALRAGAGRPRPGPLLPDHPRERGGDPALRSRSWPPRFGVGAVTRSSAAPGRDPRRPRSSLPGSGPAQSYS